jgi:hypothetical protein
MAAEVRGPRLSKISMSSKMSSRSIFHRHIDLAQSSHWPAPITLTGQNWFLYRIGQVAANTFP